MKRKTVGWVLAVALVAGVSVFAAPAVTHAGTIRTICVTVGSITWVNAGAADPSCNQGTVVPVAAWVFPKVIPTSNALVLTQTGGATGFDFDTSEGQLPGCSTCTVTIRINGSIVPNTGQPGSGLLLANGNNDPGGAAHNEAANYLVYNFDFLVGGDHFKVDVGYADNVHTNTCADADQNCFPGPGPGQSFLERWDTSPASGFPIQLLGAGTTAPGFPNPPGAGHCVPTGNNCFDAGVIWITELAAPPVPEPSTLLLLGAGIMGLAVYVRRRNQQRD